MIVLRKIRSLLLTATFAIVSFLALRAEAGVFDFVGRTLFEILRALVLLVLVESRPVTLQLILVRLRLGCLMLLCFREREAVIGSLGHSLLLLLGGLGAVEPGEWIVVLLRLPAGLEAHVRNELIGANLGLWLRLQGTQADLLALVAFASLLPSRHLG